MRLRVMLPMSNWKRYDELAKLQCEISIASKINPSCILNPVPPPVVTVVYAVLAEVAEADSYKKHFYPPKDCWTMHFVRHRLARRILVYYRISIYV